MTDTNSSHNPQELTEQQIREIKDELNLVQRMLDHKIKGFPSQTTEDQLTTMKGEAKLFKEIIDRHMKHYPDGRPTNPNLPRIEILTEAIKTALLYRNEIKNRLKPFEAAREIPNGNQYRLWEMPEQNNESHSNMGLESTRQWRTHAYIPSNQSDKKFSDRMLTMVQHFDGSFKNFPEFIQNFNTFVDKTNACDDTKLCCFRKFLDPFSKAMIAGMNNYVESYLKICDYYSNPSLIKEEVIKDLRKLPDIHDYRQVKKMVDNLAIIRTKYNQLASIPEHRSFMEREFLGLISRKFPREVLEKSTHLIRHPNRIHTFMTDAEIFVDNWQEDFATREAEYYYSERVMNPGPSHHQPERYPHDRRNNRNYFHNNQRNRQPMSRPFQNQNNRLNYAPQQNQHEQQNQNQAQARAPSCVFCGGEHPQRDCQLSVTEKKANLLASGRCELCLQRGHRRQDCRARRPTCHRCKGEHLFWLCPRLITGQTNTSNQNNQRPPTVPEVNVITLPTPGLTQIAIQINKTPSLAMFDTGATHCIMNEEQCKLLGLKLQPGELPIKTANQQTKAIGTVDVKLKIGVIKRNHTFVVMPDANYCVLGVDAIRKFKLARSPYGKIDQIIASEAYKIKTRQCPGKGGDANQYEFDIGYIKGETNQEADFLSRNPNFEVNVLSLDRLEVLHRPLLQNPPRGCVKYNNHIVKVRKDVRRYYLPEQEALQELRRIHEEKGHLGMVKTNQHFALKYFANKQNDLVMKIVNGCDICKRAKKQIRKYGEIDKLGPATEPLQIVHIDTKGGFSEPRVKTRYLHIAIDAFSRFIWIRASQHQNSQDYLNLLQQIEEDGTPSKIVTDRYGAFKSDRFRSVLRTKSIVLVHTPTAHPQSNGLVERVGQTIVEKLRCKRLIDETRSWSALAKEVADEYNHTIHSSTKFTPAYLLAGRDPDEIYHGHDLNNDRKSALEHSQSAYQKEFKRIVQKQIPWKLKLGDMVYADLADELNKKKLDPVYRGPFKVINKISEVMFEIKLPDRTEKVHIGKLKPFVPAVGIGDDE